LNIKIVTGKTVGLLNDALILKEASLSTLRNCTIIRTHPYQASFCEKILAKSIKGLSKIIKKKDMFFFVEFTAQRWMFKKNINIFIPNQEWYYSCYDDSLKNCDYILCKTRMAEEIFNKINSSVRYIGFTSQDKYDERYSYQKDYRKFLHVRGQSPCKGTLELVQLWKEHQEWPELLVVCRKAPELTSFNCRNIRILDGFLSNDELSRYQNIYGIHLCPSSVEGFGHYIAEALSCKNVVLTTNAPPMNELIDESCGFLVDHDSEESLNLGTVYKVSRESLEQNILKILSMPTSCLEEMGGAARARYDLMKQIFRSNMDSFIKDVLATIVR